jgi:hypothetical protein
VTALDDPVGTVAWSSREDLPAVTVLPGGGLKSPIYLVHPDGTGLRRLRLPERRPPCLLRGELAAPRAAPVRDELDPRLQLPRVYPRRGHGPRTAQ